MYFWFLLVDDRIWKDDFVECHFRTITHRIRHDSSKWWIVEQKVATQNLLRSPARCFLHRTHFEADFSSMYITSPNCVSCHFLLFIVSLLSDCDLNLLRLMFLQYTALLRLPDSMSYSDKIQHVNHIIEILDLQRCQDTSESSFFLRNLDFFSFFFSIFQRNMFANYCTFSPVTLLLQSLAMDCGGDCLVAKRSVRILLANCWPIRHSYFWM